MVILIGAREVGKRFVFIVATVVTVGCTLRECKDVELISFENLDKRMSRKG